MKLIADLHIHSRFSRATSKNLDFVSLHRGALEKGIGIVGTGDFTHPGWMGEIEDQLVPAEEGLFRLRPDLARKAESGVPKACAGEVRFVLQVEISNIYKKDERTRKNHNLVFVPTIEAAKRFSEKLASIGNIASDGRPILGLDARDLLEITLETDPLAFLIPAHIWTPWFSMLGSKSGFDSVAACFGDLAGEIFAVETGLSSDPPMNWRMSELDGMTLVSNSDAHSVAKLGREANLLDIEIGYEPLLNAIRTRAGFLGTIEFFPEEGKYHLDGHRKCGLCLGPEETRTLGGRCPECGGKITVGVMSRVMELAAPEREEGFSPEGRPGFESLVPLAEVCGEVLGVGPGSKRVTALASRLLAALGPELGILKDVPLEDIEGAGGALVKEAIRRIRTGEMAIQPGYDGEFGVVSVFSREERDRLLGQTAFLGVPGFAGKKKKEPARRETQDVGVTVAAAAPEEKVAQKGEEKTSPQDEKRDVSDPLYGLNPHQRQVASTVSGPLLVVAGPGTGKTRTLVARIAEQVRSGRVAPGEVLAISFTRQAAEELQQRLDTLLGGGEEAPVATTFHGFGRSLLKEFLERDVEILDDEGRHEVGALVLGDGAKGRDVTAFIDVVSLAKQHTDPLVHLERDTGAEERFRQYEALLARRNAVDIDDLVLHAYELLASRPEVAAEVAARYRSVSVDEYQDINDVQAALIKAICNEGESLIAIGDPDQSIYGFRGSKPGHFRRFEEAYPQATRISLSTGYRFGRHIRDVAAAVLSPAAPLEVIQDGPRVEWVGCPTAKSEAEQIVVRIEQIVGGTSFFAVDSGRGESEEEWQVGFGDIAVLTRMKRQQGVVLEALERSGIPVRVVAEEEPHDPRSEKVALMTMHAAKGREFEVVFLAGVEPGLMPLALEGLIGDPEEERRLLYVAITRGKQLVVLSHAKNRALFGKTLPGGPSPFIANLPRSAVRRIIPVLPQKRAEKSQLSLF